MRAKPEMKIPLLLLLLIIRILPLLILRVKTLVGLLVLVL